MGGEREAVGGWALGVGRWGGPLGWAASEGRLLVLVIASIRSVAI